jgi:hypothetical protein
VTLNKGYGQGQVNERMEWLTETSGIAMGTRHVQAEKFKHYIVSGLVSRTKTMGKA